VTSPAAPLAGDPEHGPGSVDARPHGGGRAWTIAFLAAAVATVGLLLWLGRQTTFWADGWKFIEERTQWDAAAFLAPHWEHPVPLTALVWKVLFETVGIGSITPYLAAVALAHVLVAGAVFHIVRRSAGPAAAFAAGVLLLLLGTGGEALLIALSLNLVGACAAGAWALALFLEEPGRGRRVAIAALLLVAVGFSGAGLFFVAAIGATALVLPGRWREILLTVPAVAAYVLWQLTWGTGGLTSRATGVLDELRAYLEAGVGHAVGAVVGLGDAIGLVLAVLLVVATGWHLLGRRPMMAGAVAGTVGLVAVFVVTGLARATASAAGGESPAEASRYVYLAAPFILVAGGAWLSRRPPVSLRDARSALPLLAVLAIALAGNARQLVGWRDLVNGFGDEARAAIAILTQYGGSPAFPGDRRAVPPEGSYLDLLPAPDRLRAIVDRYGDPSAGADIPPVTMERVLLGYVGASFQAATLDAVPPGVTAPAVVGDAAGTSVGPDGCLAVGSGSGPSPLIVTAPGGSRLIVATDVPVGIDASLSADGTFSSPEVRAVQPGPGAPVALLLPDVDADRPWSVQLSPAAAGGYRVCLAEG
jgi:hypothetical protein